MKTQSVRLIDVFALGPFMIYAANVGLRGWKRDVMLVSGMATIYYNLRNYLIDEGKL